MIILGFSHFKAAHNTSAAIIRDGRLVAAAEEERFTRVKHDGSVPVNAIDFCLRAAGVPMSDVDLVAFPDTPFRTGRDSAHAEIELDLLRRLRHEGSVSARSIWHKRALDLWLSARLPMGNFGLSSEVAFALAELRHRYGELPPLRYVDHHRSHAAAAFFTSGLDEAAVTTIDGRGGNYATVGWDANGYKLRRTFAEAYTNSIGIFYEDCTRYLGFDALQAGKTMGLAPYGNPDVLAEKVAVLLSTSGENAYSYQGKPNEQLLGFPPRSNVAALCAPYPDFAAAVQKAFGRAVRRSVYRATQLTEKNSLCLGGGAAYNCTTNGELRTSATGAPPWVFPAAGDAGLSVGAALFCAAERGELVCERLPHAYWGPGFSSSECEEFLRAEKRVIFRRANDIESETARMLADGAVVGWFQGRMELGPRALGNRSILADPRSAAIRDRVNDIKRRERWRPLAPVVLAEYARQYFELEGPSEFMLFAAPVRHGKRGIIPGVVHVDGSARPQTVTRGQNARLYDLLAAFDRITSVPMLLNTSFNDASEPIVCRPTDAIRTFLATGLDALILEDFIVTPANRPGE
jgi:carbamoyltransferase